MNRTIYDTDFAQYLPEALKTDENITGIAKALSTKLLEVSGIMDSVLIYARIDQLPEDLLDVLAYDMHVDWYNDAYPIAAKRDIIKNSVKVHKKMGTKFAVKKALGSIYPQSEVEEWFEYGGEPHHFRIVCDVTNSRIEASWSDIVRAVKMYKRLSSHMEEVTYQAHIHGIIKTETNYWIYTAPATGRVSAGTYPQRNTRGGQAANTYVIATAARKSKYTTPQAGTKPERAVIFNSQTIDINADTAHTDFEYTVKATGQTQAGEEPQRNTVGVSDAGEIASTVAAAGFGYKTKMCGSNQKL